MAKLRRLHQGRSDQSAVIFMHGLGGDWIETWRHSETSDKDTWPHWIGRDVDCDVWTLQYDAALSAWTEQAMPITDQADQVADLLATEAGLRGRSLILVGHSMGGLVIKALVVQGRAKSDLRIQELVRRIAAVCFIATPHTGSQLANLALAIGGVFRPNPQMEQLKAHDPILRQLGQMFRQAQREMKLRVRVFTETQDVTLERRLFGFAVRTVGIRVVDPGNADPGLDGVTAVPMAANHFSICKPRSREDHIHQSLYDFVIEVSSSTAMPEQETEAPGHVVRQSPNVIDEGQHTAGTDSTVNAAPVAASSNRPGDTNTAGHSDVLPTDIPPQRPVIPKRLIRGAIMAVVVTIAMVGFHDWWVGQQIVVRLDADSKDLATIAQIATADMSAALRAARHQVTDKDDRLLGNLVPRSAMTLLARLELRGQVLMRRVGAEEPHSPAQPDLAFDPVLLMAHSQALSAAWRRAWHVDVQLGVQVSAKEVPAEAGNSLLLAAAAQSAIAQGRTKEACEIMKEARTESPPAFELVDGTNVVADCLAQIPDPARVASGMGDAASAPTAENVDGNQEKQAQVSLEEQSDLWVKLVTHVAAAPHIRTNGWTFSEPVLPKDMKLRLRSFFFPGAQFMPFLLRAGPITGSTTNNVQAPDGTAFIISGAEFNAPPQQDGKPVSVSPAGLLKLQGSSPNHLDMAWRGNLYRAGGVTSLAINTRGDARVAVLPRDGSMRLNIDVLSSDEWDQIMQPRWTLLHPSDDSSRPCGKNTVQLATGGFEGICPDTDIRKRSSRAAICLRKDDFGFVAVTGTTGLSLYEFMKVLGDPRGFGCHTALNLDGADKIQFAVPGESQMSHSSRQRVASFIAVVPRRQQK